jgi:Bacterial Ig-like domain
MTLRDATHDRYLAAGLSASVLVGVATLLASAQTPGRLATTPAALRAAPVFYHGKQIAVLGSFTQERELVKLEPMPAGTPAPGGDLSSRGIYVYWRERPSRSTGEVRGEFWDLGRLNEGDPRFSSYDFRSLIDTVMQGRWPGRDQLFVIIGASAIEAVLPDAPTLRAIALAPERYENRSVTVSGRFRGRNLYADVAAPLPTPTKWDFVLQSADAAMWISGMRPRGKGFELDPSARVDTGRWVQVGGTVRREGSRTWIEARDIDLAAPPEETPIEIVVPPTPKEPPPAVVFSAPVPDETDVETGVTVRIQFSRDMDGRTLKDRIRVSYHPPPQTASPPPAPPPWTFGYNVGSRGIEIKFGKPLERFQTVKVELLDGIKAIDGEPLAPWTLTFSTGR